MSLSHMMVPFKPWHYVWLNTGIPVSDRVLAEMETQRSWTAIVHGDVVACGGTMLQWAGRHVAWAYMSDATCRNMRFITTCARRIVAEAKGRVEMTVKCDFKAGHRWAKMLGFEVECPLMKTYGPLGEDHTLYVRFN